MSTITVIQDNMSLCVSVAVGEQFNVGRFNVVLSCECDVILECNARVPRVSVIFPTSKTGAQAFYLNPTRGMATDWFNVEPI